MEDKRFWEIYNEERDKLGQLPDADSDFIALENAYNRIEEEKINRQ